MNSLDKLAEEKYYLNTPAGKTWLHIAETLGVDPRFIYEGRGANLGVWTTRKKDEWSPVELTRPIGYSTHVHARIFTHRGTSEGKSALEIAIEYEFTDCAGETYHAFQGWLESPDEFDLVLKMIGLK